MNRQIEMDFDAHILFSMSKYQYQYNLRYINSYISNDKNITINNIGLIVAIYISYKIYRECKMAAEYHL